MGGVDARELRHQFSNALTHQSRSGDCPLELRRYHHHHHPASISASLEIADVATMAGPSKCKWFPPRVLKYLHTDQLFRSPDP